MTEMAKSDSGAAAQAAAKPSPVRAEVRRFLRSAVPFLLVGAAIYGALYAASERLIGRYALRNRFHMVKTAPRTGYDCVILGASHAVVLDNRDMNARLEEMTGQTILNLATVGGGITVNRLLLEYFLDEHRTGSVVYVLDSFPFYSREWNEERLLDRKLFLRAPWDPTLAARLLRNQAAWPVAADYITGFSKINNPDRFEPDTHVQEGPRFERVYRPVEQIDRQRIAYLYPEGTSEASGADSAYFAEFEKLIRDVLSRGIQFIVVRPPIPERVYRMIPNERQFDVTIKRMLERVGVELHDFSSADNEEQFFFDSDHLNRDGVLNFFEHHLRAVLKPDRPEE